MEGQGRVSINLTHSDTMKEACAVIVDLENAYSQTHAKQCYPSTNTIP